MTKERAAQPQPSLTLGPIQLRQRTLFLISVLLLANSVLRGIKAPGRWACTELLFNYDFGFHKRGLLGAVISAVDVSPLYHYDTCFWYGVTILAINILLTAMILKRLISTAHPSSSAVALLFSSSFSFVILSLCMGYGDQIGVASSLLLILTKNYYCRLVLTSVLAPLMILIHETNFITLLPAMMFFLFLESNEHPFHRKILELSIPLILSVVTVLLIGGAHTSSAAIEMMYKSLQAKADYPLYKGEFDVLTSTFSQNLYENLDEWKAPAMWGYFLSVSIVTLPTTIYILVATLKTLAANELGVLPRIAAALASLAPQAANIFGSDLNRWATLATTASFLVFAKTALYVKGDAGDLTRFPAPRLVIPPALVAINLTSSIYFSSRDVMESFPFDRRISDIVLVISGKTAFPPRPE